MKLMSAFFLYAALSCLNAPVHSLEIGHSKQLSGGNYNDLADMSRIAGAVYSRKAIPGWSLAKSHNFDGKWGGKDNVGVYRKHSTCALGISGSDDWKDWMQNAAAAKVSNWRHAVYNAHAGFSTEANGVLNAGWKYTDLKNYLRASQCSHGVAVVGHSLGGAVASFISAYSNRHNQWTTTYLYTFGAPGPSKDRIRNPKTSNSCFKGGRFYNLDSVQGDPVPALAYSVGYVHPYVDAVRLYYPTFGSKRAYHYGCTGDNAKKYPRWGRLMTGALTHSISKYTDRIVTTSRDRGTLNARAPTIPVPPPPPPPPPPRPRPRPRPRPWWQVWRRPRPSSRRRRRWR